MNGPMHTNSIFQKFEFKLKCYFATTLIAWEEVYIRRQRPWSLHFLYIFAEYIV